MNWGHTSAVARKEWAGYFNSPVAYVFLVIFLALASFFLFQFENFFESRQASLTQFFFWLQVLYLFFVPALTMRLWAEEQRSNTIELLFTMPVRPMDIILGKFLAAWGMMGLTLVLTLPIVVTTCILGDPDPGPIVTGYLGSFLTAGAFVAVGVLCSAITKNQVVGFILGVVALFVGLMMSGLPPVTNLLGSFLPRVLVDGIAGVSIFSHIHQLNRGVLDFRDVVYFISVMAVMLFAVRVLLVGRSTKRAGEVPGGVSLVAVTAVVIAFNALLAAFPGLRADLTEDKLFTLSDGTRAVVKDLPNDVTLKFYFSRSQDNLPTQIGQFAQRVEDMLKEYEAASGGSVVLEIYDPKPFSDDAEWARNYGLQGAMLDPRGGDEFYMGLVAVSGSRDKAIPFMNPSTEERLEYDLTKLISEVATPNKPQVGLLSALPIAGGGGDPMAAMRGQRPPEAWAAIQQLRQLYDVVSLQPGTDAINKNIDTLVVIHPKQLPPQTVWAIDQFVLRGGKLLLAVDAMSLAEQEVMPQRNNQFAMFQSGSDLNPLTRAWGYTLEPGKLFADKGATTELSAGPNGGVQPSPVFVSVTKEMVNKDDLATADLDLVHVPLGGVWKGVPADGLEATVLIHGTEQSGTVDAMQAMGGGTDLMKAVIGSPELPLMVRLQGTFKTAFPNGKPAPASPPGQAPPPSADPEPGLAESVRPSVVVLISDVDFLYDRFAVRPVRDLFGGQSLQAVNDNLTLFLNVVEQLSGNLALIGLRSRGTVQRPFTLVREIEAKAQEKFQAEAERLEATLAEAQANVNKLQQGKTGEQQFILSPAQRSELKKFEQAQLETRKQLHEVQKDLRRDVDVLGARIKVLNIGLVPLLIALYGVVHYFVRKSRAVRRAA